MFLRSCFFIFRKVIYLDVFIYICVCMKVIIVCYSVFLVMCLSFSCGSKGNSYEGRVAANSNSHNTTNIEENAQDNIATVRVEVIDEKDEPIIGAKVTCLEALSTEDETTNKGVATFEIKNEGQASVKFKAERKSYRGLSGERYGLEQISLSRGRNESRVVTIKLQLKEDVSTINKTRSASPSDRPTKIEVPIIFSKGQLGKLKLLLKVTVQIGNKVAKEINYSDTENGIVLDFLESDEIHVITLFFKEDTNSNKDSRVFRKKIKKGLKIDF